MKQLNEKWFKLKVPSLILFLIAFNKQSVNRVSVDEKQLQGCEPVKFLITPNKDKECSTRQCSSLPNFHVYTHNDSNTTGSQIETSSSWGPQTSKNHLGGALFFSSYSFSTYNNLPPQNFSYCTLILHLQTDKTATSMLKFYYNNVYLYITINNNKVSWDTQ